MKDIPIAGRNLTVVCMGTDLLIVDECMEGIANL